MCNHEALLILEEEIGLLGDKIITRYHLCNDWSWTYWKSRAYLTACVAIAWKKNVPIHGRKVADTHIKQHSEGEAFLNSQRQLAWPRELWHPEDMALEPDDYLRDIDPEKDNFGHHSALKIWLRLEEKGLLDCDLSYQNIRQKFENAESLITYTNMLMARQKNI